MRWFPATVGFTSPSSMTQKAAPELWSGKATRLLLSLVEKGIPLRRLSRNRHSATALAAGKESEKMTPATGSTASTSPWR